MCQEQESLYTDYSKCIRTFTVIMNHFITNQIDAIHFQIMYILIFVLFLYQCMKIYTYAKSYALTNNIINLEFQLLFCIMNLVRINQLTYTYMGHQLDQRPNGWKVDGHSLQYCDSLFIADVGGKCHVRYEINGFYMDTNLYLNSLAIQIITFFWYKNISPSMFLSISKVLMNQKIKLKSKLIYLAFIIIDIIMIIGQIAVCLSGYREQEVQGLQISQLIFISLQFLFFLYNIWKQNKIRSNQDRTLELLNKKRMNIIALGISAFIFVRIIYIILTFYVFEQEQLIQQYMRTQDQSIIYLVINLVSEFGFRILLIKLF